MTVGVCVGNSGTIRVAVGQVRVAPGRPRENTARVLEAVRRGREAGASVLVLPEMVIPGYLLGDEWERTAFLRECEACGERVCEASAGLTVVFGNVGIDWDRRGEDGRIRKYNACFVVSDGRFLGPAGLGMPFVPKTLMPNYREFDDSRHFFDARKLAAERGVRIEDLLEPVETAGGLRLGCMLCEDGWDGDYAVSPVSVLAGKGSRLLVNASCSPFTADKNAKRRRVFGAHARRHGVALVYANSVGIQNNGKTVFCFDGRSGVYDAEGAFHAGPPAFEEGVSGFDVWPVSGAVAGEAELARDDGVVEIWEALRYGAGRFLEQVGLGRVVVGASGGVDSALTAALYATLLDPKDLMLASMPSRFNSALTRGAAERLARNLGCLFVTVSIEESVALTARQVDGLVASSADGARREVMRLSGAMLENVQARDRSSRVLAALSAAFGGGFTCNANKSEMTVGYTTLYGDLGGFLAALGDVWKTEVYALARHVNGGVFGGRSVIPEETLTVKPSAELSDQQDVTKGLGDPLCYEYHDCLFRGWVENWSRRTPEDDLECYLRGDLEESIGYGGRIEDLFDGIEGFVRDLERWWMAYQGLGVAKRIQAPPVLAVKRRAFGFDHREAQIGARFTDRYVALRDRALARHSASTA